MIQAFRRHGHSSGSRVFASAAASLALLLSACGGPAGPAISKEDQDAAAKMHPKVLGEFGGAYSGEQAAYLARVGERVASAAGIGGECKFTLVNTDVVNAFAIPGCYIYVTRGLMGIVNSEGELAAVLGHELGHITANHSLEQRRRSIISQLGVLAVETITGSRRLARIAGAAAGFSNLRYSRGDEYEADELGIDYIRKAGYDPWAAPEMLELLGRFQQFKAGAQGDEADAKTIPEWAMTHPLTDKRIMHAREDVEKTGIKRPPEVVGDDAYLQEIDGLLYGDDPAQGFVLGRRFAHPDMRVAFEAPKGFTLTNSPRAVLIQGPDGTHGQFGGGKMSDGSLKTYTEQLVRQLFDRKVVQIVSGRPFTTNGVAGFVVQATLATGSGNVPVSIATYAGPDEQAYHFIMMSKPDGQASQQIGGLFNSFRLLSPEEANKLRPRYIRVIHAGAGATTQSLAERIDAERPSDMLLMLNSHAADAPWTAGQPVKVVQYADR